MDQFVGLRREVHRYAEISGNEHETTRRIRNIAIKHGIEEGWITMSKLTGLWIDIAGEAEPEGRDFKVALRADIDALQMIEGNEDLEYRSVNVGAAHMCGHDGHLASLAAFIPQFMAKRKQLPRNKSVRLIFQPAEEESKIAGAKTLISEGCLQGVNEIYGFHNHNVNLLPFGYFSCKEGPMMSASAQVHITIQGTGGHGSEPENLKYALPKAIAFYQNMQAFTQQLKQKHGDNLTVMFPVLKSGERYNVISETVNIQGTLRTYSDKITEQILDRIQSQLKDIEAGGFKTSLEYSGGIVTSNHAKEIENVKRVAASLYGDKLVGELGMPTKASEDFGHYLLQVPGAFFFVCGADEQHSGIPHNPNYNFNDRLIPLISDFWLHLTLDRLSS